jgi:hypothetical protein
MTPCFVFAMQPRTRTTRGHNPKLERSLSFSVST